MNGKRVATIICWCISALVLLGFAAWLLIASPIGDGSFGIINFGRTTVNGLSIENLRGPFEVVGSQRIAKDSIDSFDINWITGEVTVLPHDGNEIIITESAQRTLSENEVMSVETSNNTVTINFIERRAGIRRMPTKRLEVLIPAELAQNLDSFVIDSTSAALNVSDISATEFNLGGVSGRQTISSVHAQAIRVGSTSGAIDLTDSAADSIWANTVSGAISLRRAVADTATIRTTSGALYLSDTLAGTLTTSSVSGAHSLSGAFVVADLSTTSGRLAFTSSIVPDSFSASSISGAVTITIPDDGVITVSHTSVSGRLTSELPVIMQSVGAQFRISTTSGAVNINELR